MEGGTMKYIGEVEGKQAVIVELTQGEYHALTRLAEECGPPASSGFDVGGVPSHGAFSSTWDIEGPVKTVDAFANLVAHTSIALEQLALFHMRLVEGGGKEDLMSPQLVEFYKKWVREKG
jgi:hypothetical protein